MNIATAMKTEMAVKEPAVTIKKVLYATDFSEASMSALPLAAGVARQYGSQLSIIHIWSTLPPVLTGPQVGINPIPPMNEYDRAEEYARSEMDRILQNSALNGLAARGVVLLGAPVEEIDRIVREEGFDLLVIGTHGQTGFKHMVMGSVTEDICRKVTCPVLTVGPKIDTQSTHFEHLKHILVPTDLSDESRAVLPYIASLATEYGSTVTVLHVLPPEIAGNPDSNSLLEPLRHEMHRYCAPMLLSPGCRAEYRFEFGDPAVCVRVVAKEKNIGLIAMGVREAFPFFTQLHTTLPYTLIATSPCPVLTVKAKR